MFMYLWPYLQYLVNVNKLLWNYFAAIQDSVVYEFTWAAQAQNETFITTSYEYGRFSQGGSHKNLAGISPKKDLSQFQRKSAHAPQKELPKRKL